MGVKALKKVFFTLLFVVVVLLSYHVRIYKIWAPEGQEAGSFSAYSFFGPLPAAFLGSFWGVVSVLATQILHRVELGKLPLPVGLFALVRFFIMPITTVYFERYGKDVRIILLPMLLFLAYQMSPNGHWIYSLYWLIPIFFPVLMPKNLFARSLSSTFVAHAIGSVAFLYLFDTTPEFWLSLIPIVALERLTFATGISLSYVAMNTLLANLFPEEDALKIEERYVLRLPVVGVGKS